MSKAGDVVENPVTGERAVIYRKYLERAPSGFVKVEPMDVAAALAEFRARSTESRKAREERALGLDMCPRQSSSAANEKSGLPPTEIRNAYTARTSMRAIPRRVAGA